MAETGDGTQGLAKTSTPVSPWERGRRASVQRCAPSREPGHSAS